MSATEPVVDRRLAQLSAILTALLLLNHLAMAAGATRYAPVVLLCLIVLGVAGFLLASDRQHWPFRIFLAVLLLICLGTPTDGWDARSIWLFHAKRIHLEADLFAQLDNYAVWSHNDYPVLVPALSAAIAATMGGWNEVAPKAGALLAMAPALVLLAAVLRSTQAQLLMCLLLVVFARTHLVDGYMDAVLGVQLSAVVLGIVAVAGRPGADGSSTRYPLALAAGCLIAAMPLVKNEGLAAALLAMGVAGFLVLRGASARSAGKFLLVGLGCMVPVAAWRSAVAVSGITTDLAGSHLTSRLLERLSDPASHALVLSHLGGKSLTAALLLVAAYYLGRNRFLVAAGLAICAAYLALLYLVYLSTPYDLQWHLSTSARRVILPVVILAAACLCSALEPGLRRKPAAILA